MNVLMVRMKELGWYVCPVTYVPTYQTSIGERLNVVLSNKELVSEWHNHCKTERDLMINHLKLPVNVCGILHVAFAIFHILRLALSVSSIAQAFLLCNLELSVCYPFILHPFDFDLISASLLRKRSPSVRPSVKMLSNNAVTF